MVIKTDICPKSGLKREIKFIKFSDDIIKKTIFLNCSLNYYNKETDEFIGNNIFSKDFFLITIDNENVINGIGEYDYWKGLLNDFNGQKEKGINSFDSFCAYIIMKAYLEGRFN
jgi:hypothetical protein